MNTRQFLKQIGLDEVRLCHLPKGGKPRNYTKPVGDLTNEDIELPDGAVYFCPYRLKPGAHQNLENLDGTKVLIADCDNGAPKELYDLDPDFIVASGGLTEQGIVKVHAYWVLDSVVPNAEAAALNLEIARYLGTDDCFGKRPTQIIRLPGSWHCKGTPRKCEILRYNHHAGGRSMSQVRGLMGHTTPVEAPEEPATFDDLLLRTREDWRPPVVRRVDEDDIVIGMGASSEVDGHTVSRQDYVNSLVGALAAQAAGRPALFDVLLEVALERVDKHVDTSDGRWDPEEVRRLFRKYATHDAQQKAKQADPTGSKTFQRKAITPEEMAAPPDIREVLVENLIPLGAPTLLVAQGGTGKTSLALELCAKIAYQAATGEQQYVLGERVCASGKAVLVSMEEDRAELLRKLWSVDIPDWNAVTTGGLLEVYGSDDIPGHDLRPWHQAPGGRGEPEANPVWESFVDALAGDPDVRVVVLDNAMLLLHDDSNSDHSTRKVTSQISRLQRELGDKATVITIHHVTKAANDGDPDTLSANDSKGSGSLVDASRHVIAVKRLKHSTKTDPYFSQIPDRFAQLAVIGAVKSNVGLFRPRKVVHLRSEEVQLNATSRWTRHHWDVIPEPDDSDTKF